MIGSCRDVAARPGVGSMAEGARMPQTDDRVAGTLLGLAVGDAVGAPYEFGAPVRPADVAPIGGGIADWAPGEWTDDTQMAVCIAQEAASGSLDPVRIGQGFLDWYASGPPDVGNQTRAVLRRAHSPEELATHAAAHFAAHPHGSAGNGSLMRTAPVAIACLGDDERLADAARQISRLTHADPLAGDACVLWCIAIDRAIREGRLDGVRDGLRCLDDPQQADRWAQWLDDAEGRPPEDFAPNGFVVTALQAAHAAIQQTPVPGDRPGDHLELALRRAVSIGDDTDTVAAIAGGLLGARWGRSAIPAEWLGVLHGWPGLRADDLASLALQSANRNGGRP